jgi:hypothetical protein
MTRHHQVHALTGVLEHLRLTEVRHCPKYVSYIVAKTGQMGEIKARHFHAKTGVQHYQRLDKV